MVNFPPQVFSRPPTRSTLDDGIRFAIFVFVSTGPLLVENLGGDKLIQFILDEFADPLPIRAVDQCMSPSKLSHRTSVQANSASSLEGFCARAVSWSILLGFQYNLSPEEKEFLPIFTSGASPPDPHFTPDRTTVKSGRSRCHPHRRRLSRGSYVLELQKIYQQHGCRFSDM